MKRIQLVNIGDFPRWKPQVVALLQSQLSGARSEGDRQNSLRDWLLDQLADKAPFLGLASVDEILTALDTSYECCIFEGPSGPSKYISKNIHEIARYNCCGPCRILADALAANFPESRLTTPLLAPPRRPLWDKFSMALDTPGGPGQDASMYKYVTVDRASETFYIVLTTSVDNSIKQHLPSVSGDAIGLALVMMEKCRTSHTLCAPMDGNYVPKRLVFVGNGSADPYLIETDASGIDKRDLSCYAALSYCWGSTGGTYTTTRENIDMNKSGIPLLQLPKTIQDAVRVCRALRIDYLWVDAFCIVQNDLGEQDWHDQCGQMKDIYSNCLLAIAAEDTHACGQGFLASWGSIILKGPSDAGLYAWIASEAQLTPRSLSARGWALQERILPHRTLRFTTSGMRWECNKEFCHENGSTNIDLLSLAFRSIRLMASGRRNEPPATIGCTGPDEEARESTHITDFLTSGTHSSVYYSWASIVENYSARNLTKSRDKLSALSGLASLIATSISRSENTYLAGLWRGDLAAGLLWYVTGPGVPSRYQLYTAPSWSWASIDGRVSYFLERYQFALEPEISVVNASCDYSPSDPTGRVSAGSITVSGKLAFVSVDVIPCPRGYRSEYSGRPGCASRIHKNQVVLVGRLGIDGEKCQYEVLCDEHMPLTHGNGLPGFFGFRDSKAARYFCLSVARMSDPRTTGVRHWWLLLERTSPFQEVYKRIGLGYYQFLYRRFHLFDDVSAKTITII